MKGRRWARWFWAALLPLALLAGCLAPGPLPPPLSWESASATATAAAAQAATAEAQARVLSVALTATRGAASPLATPQVTPQPTSSVPLLHRTHNILVMGMDHRDNDPDPSWRTDTLMVVAIDAATDRVGVVSIPRDLYLNIPGLGWARINQADFYGETSRYPGGGPALVRRVLTETLDLPVQDYVRVQMSGLVKLVDVLGGVTVTLACPLYERTPDATSPNGVRDWQLPAGPVHLDGETAKKFVTYRYVTSDFGRTQRQQQLIWAIRDRVLQGDLLGRVPALWQALGETFTTDLSLGAVVDLARLGARLKPENVHGLVWGTDVLDYYSTKQGAQVLVIKDRARMLEQLKGLFDARPLASLGARASGQGGCAPPPALEPPFGSSEPITGTLPAGPPAGAQPPR